MSFVSEIERYKQLVKDVEKLKSDIADIATSKGVTIEAGTDTILSVVQKIVNTPSQTKTYEVESIDNGDGTQTLQIKDYTSQ